MKKSNLLKTLVLAGAMAFSGHAAKAQSNVEYIQNAKTETSRIRPNLFYNLPGDVSAYTFIEFYGDGENYYGKTTLNKKLGAGISARSEIKNSSFFKDNASLGFTYAIPTKELSASLKFLPVTANTEGDINYPMNVGYFASKNFGPVNVCSFGEYNIGTKSWGYGETYVGYKKGQFELAVGVDMRSDPENVIRLDPGLKLKFTPRGE